MASPVSNSNRSTAFDLLAEPVRRWIWDQRWMELRDIQERAIAGLLDGGDERDIIITAPTAGGKTEAAFLPLLSAALKEPSPRGFDLLYIAPLRALINDQTRRMEDLCEYVGLPVHPWHGDVSQAVKNRARRHPRGVLLITPESLEALFVLRGTEIPTLFDQTRAVIIDELHSFLDNERGVHLRSLLARLERSVQRRIRRVGLSATLSQMDEVKTYIRPEDAGSVEILASAGDETDLKVQIRGYLAGDDDAGAAARRQVAEHLFKYLRGSSNLIFAGSRENVELYADLLRDQSEQARAPLDFFPHHASLSRSHRQDVEERLKTSETATAICTSTLELGIDIGSIDCVAQIGPPFSVSSLRQRLGRSGRRGQAAVLRMYAIERAVNDKSGAVDRLHLGLIRSIAMVELLIERWYEPPARDALHLSTLLHQILSVITEHGGATASLIYDILCRRGPFRQVSAQQFTALLRDMGHAEVALIEQGPDGALLLGPRGEQLVEHYSFYAVFQSPEEYRVLAGSVQIGMLPASRVFLPEMSIILSGRRWRIVAVHDDDKVIDVVADPTGTAPNFGGSGGLIHDRITERMRDVLSGSEVPRYLDEVAVRLLEAARAEFERLELTERRICRTGAVEQLVATWAGTVKTSTLALKLQDMDFKVGEHDGILVVSTTGGGQSLESALREIAAQSEDEIAEEWLSGWRGMANEKFHRHIGPALLYQDVCSSVLAVRTLPETARDILSMDECPPTGAPH